MVEKWLRRGNKWHRGKKEKLFDKIVEEGSIQQQKE
jgi:hypothetical protein